MTAESYWAAVGLALLATFVVHALPGLRYRFLASCAAWLLCAAFVWREGREVDLLAVPGAALLALTALKLVQPDH